MELWLKSLIIWVILGRLCKSLLLERRDRVAQQPVLIASQIILSITSRVYRQNR